jgi:hypothetical protein
MSPDQLTQMQPALSNEMLIAMAVGYAVVYLFFVYCLARIGVKLGHSFGHAFLMALIPIVNIFFILQLAKKPLWWFILFIIPIVNLVITVLVWMAICERLGKPGWWGVLMLIPFVNFILLLMLAFGKAQGTPAAAY